MEALKECSNPNTENTIQKKYFYPRFKSYTHKYPIRVKSLSTCNAFCIQAEILSTIVKNTLQQEHSINYIDTSKKKECQTASCSQSM